LECPRSHERPDVLKTFLQLAAAVLELLLAAQQDFKEQNSRPQEDIEGAGHEVIFYP